MDINELEVLAQLIADKLSYLQKPLLSLDEASRFLNLAKSSVYKMTSNHSLPYFKVGKLVYFKREELEKWLTSCRVASTDEITTTANNYLDGKENCHA